MIIQKTVAKKNKLRFSFNYSGRLSAVKKPIWKNATFFSISRIHDCSNTFGTLVTMFVPSSRDSVRSNLSFFAQFWGEAFRLHQFPQ